MRGQVHRRRFLATTAATGAALATQRIVKASQAAGANEKIVVGVMGVNGRGSGLARTFATQDGAEVAYICDVDERAVEKATAVVAQNQRAPKGVGDFRRILDDDSVDALVIAAPDHWHAPATIMAANAGKHVYVEKPCSHNPREGEMMVAAARKNDRVVQLGTQRRSYPKIQEAMQRLHEGVIGEVLFSKSWYNNRRGSIGRGKPAAVPAWLDFDLWQGPAPVKPFQDNVVHYNWHWFWHWGTGELGNNGVHSIDLCRWGLGVDYPTQVTSGGGRYRFDDDQQTPDTHVVTFDFGGKSMNWEGRSWHPRGSEGSGFGIAFYGEKGTMLLGGGGYTIYDMSSGGGKQIENVDGSGGDNLHIGNFLTCIRQEARPNADIEEGHKSTLLCHLGNIAHRTGHTLHCDPSNGRIQDDPEAQALWGREYRPGWEPSV